MYNHTRLSDLAGLGSEEVGPKPKPNQNVGLAQGNGLFLVWIGLEECPIWATGSHQ